MLLRQALDYYLRENPDNLDIPADELDTWKVGFVGYDP